MPNNFEAQIDELKRQLADLELKKQAEDKRLEGLEFLDGHLQDFYDEYQLSEEDLLNYKRENIAKWIKSMESLEERPAIFADLQSFFVRVASGKKRRGSAAKPTGPRLEVGLYLNPYTQEQVKKVKRNPRLLDQWIEQYGLSTVQSWKQARD